MNVRLFDFGPSPFCLKVRAILEYKQVPYQRLNVMGRKFLELRRRGGIGKVPGLEIDGDLICDSTDIAYQLERRFPEPAILPAGERERALCHTLEDWADESLYFVGLYFQWIEPAGKALAPRAFGGGPLGRAAIRFSSRLIRRQVLGQGIGRKPEEMVRADLERHLDAAAALLAGDAFLLGDAPLLCDFAVAGQLTYLARTPVGGARIQARPELTAYLDRMKQLRSSTRHAA